MCAVSVGVRRSALTTGTATRASGLTAEPDVTDHSPHRPTQRDHPITYYFLTEPFTDHDPGLGLNITPCGVHLHDRVAVGQLDDG